MKSANKTSVLNIKIDPKVKKEVKKVADDLGFTLSAIVNASLKNLARTKTISYSVLEPSSMLKKAILSARKDRALGVDQEVFTNAEDFITSLRS